MAACRRAWFGSSCLQLQRTGEPRSWWRWLDGFDTSDHVLDLVVAPDGSWRWKDEDEFEAACRVGRFTRKEAAAVRRAGEAAAAAIEARAWPFDSEWSEWQPNPDWTVPTLPADMSGL